MDSYTGPRIISQSHSFHVLQYTPTFGTPGTAIMFRIHLTSTFEALNGRFARVVIGNKAIATTIRDYYDTDYGSMRLDCRAPSLDPGTYNVSIQILDGDENVVDQTVCGEFVYRSPLGDI